MTKPLESIEESPHSTFRTKRIASKSPTLGPTLTVSSSADRLIMGGNQKENRPLVRKRSKDMLRAAVSGQKKSRPEETSQAVSETRRPSSQSVCRPSSQAIRRPLSSQGFPENRSTPKKVHASVEEMRELEKETTTSEAFFSANPETSPVKNSSTPVSDAMPVVSALLPEAMQEHVRKIEHASYIAREDEVKARTLDDEFPPRSSS
ncbi:MAG: hypothetical protein Q9228_008125, partial [Teloschistes exilis]